MSAVHASSLADTSTAESKHATTYTLAIVSGLVSLGAVVVGFLLVALSILDVIAVPIAWGGALCLAGWALASMRRDRTRRG